MKAIIWQNEDLGAKFDYVDIPDDTVSQRNANYEVVSQGFSGVSYASCATSYNISSCRLIRRK